jgi:tight adherence protein C
VIYLLVFVLALMAGLLLFRALLISAPREAREGSLRRLQAYDPTSFRSAELETPASERLAAPALAALASAGAWITPQGRMARLGDRLERAGRPWKLDLNALLAIKVLALVAGGILVVILGATDVLDSVWLILVSVAVIVGSYYLPDAIVYWAANHRRRSISRSLPDFLDLLTVSVEAGLGLDAAFARIAEKLRGPLKDEVLITLHHMRIGESRETALRELARRTGVKDMEVFVTALIQSQKLGVSLGKTLRLQSENMRIVRKQRIQEKAQKMPVKLVFPLIFCIFPALFVVIVGPAAIRIYSTVLSVLGD